MARTKTKEQMMAILGDGAQYDSGKWYGKDIIEAKETVAVADGIMELIHNASDASASQIIIAVDYDNHSFIVADNGTGISATEARRICISGDERSLVKGATGIHGVGDKIAAKVLANVYYDYNKRPANFIPTSYTITTKRDDEECPWQISVCMDPAPAINEAKFIILDEMSDDFMGCLETLGSTHGTMKVFENIDESILDGNTLTAIKNRICRAYAGWVRRDEKRSIKFINFGANEWVLDRNAFKVRQNIIDYDVMLKGINNVDARHGEDDVAVVTYKNAEHLIGIQFLTISSTKAGRDHVSLTNGNNGGITICNADGVRLYSENMHVAAHALVKFANECVKKIAKINSHLATRERHMVTMTEGNKTVKCFPTELNSLNAAKIGASGKRVCIELSNEIFAEFVKTTNGCKDTIKANNPWRSAVISQMPAPMLCGMYEIIKKACDFFETEKSTKGVKEEFDGCCLMSDGSSLDYHTKGGIAKRPWAVKIHKGVGNPPMLIIQINYPMFCDIRHQRGWERHLNRIIRNNKFLCHLAQNWKSMSSEEVIQTIIAANAYDIKEYREMESQGNTTKADPKHTTYETAGENLIDSEYDEICPDDSMTDEELKETLELFGAEILNPSSEARMVG